MLAGLCYRKLAVSQIPGRQKSANGSVQQGTLEHRDPAITLETCAPVRVTFRSDAIAIAIPCGRFGELTEKLLGHAAASAVLHPHPSESLSPSLFAASRGDASMLITKACREDQRRSA